MGIIRAWPLSCYVWSWSASICVCVCVFVPVCVCVCACVCTRARVWLCQFVVVRDPLREEAQLSVVVRRWASPSLFADPVVVNLTPPPPFSHFLPSSSFLPPNSGWLGLRSRWRHSFVQACWSEIRKCGTGPTNLPLGSTYYEHTRTASKCTKYCGQKVEAFYAIL